MAIAEDHVREALKEVIDPELFVNIVDLGLVYVVSFDEVDGPPPAVAAPAAAAPAEETAAETPAESEPATDDKHTKVTIEMTMTSPACPAGPQLIAGAKKAVSQMEGVGDVEVKIVMDPPWTPDRMTEDARDQLGIF